MEAAVETMRRVHIPDAGARARDYPHQFSGGMRQRVMIAIAIALRPSVLIADEPTTALDVTVQAQVVDLLREIRAEEGMALILISHDLGLAAALSDDLMVMYGGRVAERGPLRSVIRRPGHPYTQGLIRSAPGSTAPTGRLAGIPGSPPSLDRMPEGCSFNPRCPLADDRCRTARPELVSVEPERFAACHHSKRVLDGIAP
jgi:oligopeptide transport system ATP-binding protein